MSWRQTTVDPIRRLRRARCGACGGKIGGRVNLVSLCRLATWRFPVAGNVLTHEAGRACAVLCDGCVEIGALVETIKEAVEMTDGRIVYHPLAELQELRPEQTYVIASDLDGRERIHCLVCGMKSYNRSDIINRYCGMCRRFHEA